MASINVRSGYVGVITKLERFVESCSGEDFIPTTIYALQKQLTSLRTTRERYCELQQQIIQSADTESKRQREQESYENIISRCDALDVKINELIEAMPDDPLNSTLDEMRDWVKGTMEEQNKKHQEEVQSLLRQLSNTLRAKPSPSQGNPNGEGSSQTTGQPDLMDLMRTLADTNSKQSALLEKLAASKVSKPRIKLPDIPLTKFSGKFTEWTAFRDHFRSAIISYPDLPDVEKLNYLKTALLDDAASVIRHLAPTDANFSVAWKLLEERFEKPYNIVMDHIQTFRALPSVSASNLKDFNQLCTTASETVMAVRALGVNRFDLWLIHDILQKVDNETKLLWSRECDGKLPDWDTFSKFLFKRRDSMEACGLTVPSTTAKSSKSGSPHQSSKKSHTSLVTTNAQTCKCCNQPAHPLFRCPKFLAQSPNERFQTVKQMGLCRNCIKANHMTNQCSYHPCRKCNERHNILLHEKFSGSPASPNSTAVPSSATGSQAAASTTASTPGNSQQTTALPTAGSSTRPSIVNLSTNGTSHLNISQSNVAASGTNRIFLATAMVDVIGPNGRRISCRAILDSGSQRNAMSASIQRQLNLPKRHAALSLLGIGGAKSIIQSVTDAAIHSRTSSHAYNLEFMIIPKITGDLPNWPATSDLLPIPNGVQLADPEWFVKKPIDILIGGESYWDIVLDGTIHLGDGLPKLKPTTLGYIIVGTFNPPEVLCNVVGVEDLDQTLRRFWEVESVPDDPPITDEHRAAENHFASTYSRTGEGRFLVQLPFKKNLDDSTPTLGSSRHIAVRQMLALERRFAKNATMKSLYIEVMRDYLSKGWLEPVPRDELENYSYYMPHHGVLKDSTTTRLRVVYNASSKTTNGLSLNDILLAGPTVHPDLFTVLLRFRRFEYAVTADISKMYLQLVLHSEHADFQRFVFRENITEPIRDYRIPRVCFGVKSSPFLATRALIQLAEDHQQTHPLASAIIRNCFYVDDCIYSSESLSEAKEIQTQLMDVMAFGGFVLAKWTSNYLQFEPSSSLDSEPPIFHSHDTSKTLGVRWDPLSDCFQFVSPIDSDDVIDTMRKVASAVARIYDPLGLISPVVIVAKILLQDLHKAKLNWDATISTEHALRWDNFRRGLQHVGEIQIPRLISQRSSLHRTELHGFCDASTKAYGAAIYFVGRDELGNAISHLIVSKSRVAPLDTQTIPRLELCGAVLLIELICKIRDLFIPDKEYFWTDSTIVLGWLNSPPDAYRIFVAKRVRRILKDSKSNQWFHVPTHLNPADLISRGTTPTQLATAKLWWNGPEYLSSSESTWPQNPNNPLGPELEDSKRIVLSGEVAEDSFFLQWMLSISSLRKLTTIMVYILRFYHHLRHPEATHSRDITIEERERALRKLLFLDQQHCFPEVILSLQRNHPIPAPWRFLNSLSPFLDHEGLLRVGGRLQNSAEPLAARHPILVPKSRLQELLVITEHNRQLHAPPALLLATLRQRYWLISGRATCRRVVRQCVTCIKARPSPLNQMMGNLPEHRVVLQRPFYASAVDYAGPLIYKASNLRNSKTLKGYICLFVCLSVKALHLEFVTDLTADAFIAAFRRFVGRRSAPRHMYSDCGTNFVGAHRELQRLHRSSAVLSSATAELGVVWHFNPPGAPHQGGLWEAGVKSVKYHLTRIFGHSPRTFEEISTVLCQIEGLLNSRPLCALSEDPADGDFLTPGHFLVGGPLNSLPDPSVLHIEENRLSRWQVCQKRTQEFAERWRREYLNTLQQRSKWKFPRPNVMVGDIVLLLDDSSTTWTLGRVSAVHPGSDGLVRVVSVRTSRGILKRPITKISLLPVNDTAGLTPIPRENVPATTGLGGNY